MNKTAKEREREQKAEKETEDVRRRIDAKCAITFICGTNFIPEVVDKRVYNCLTVILCPVSVT